MGLQEKRMLKTLQGNVLPEREKEMQKITGAKIKYEMNWDSMASSLNTMERFRDSAFKSLHDALASVCRDDIGHEAVKESIQKGKRSNDSLFAGRRFQHGESFAQRRRARYSPGLGGPGRLVLRRFPD